MTVEEDIQKINSKLSSLEQHIINLIIPIQAISKVLRSSDHIEEIVNLLGKPIAIDDRRLAKQLNEFKDLMNTFDDNMKKVNIKQTFDEIKYIGKRMDNVEKSLSLIHEKGLSKKIDLTFTCDGYELVKKPENYDMNDPIEDPYKKDYRILEGLDDDMKKVICSRYGLLGTKLKTQKDIAKSMKMGVSKIQVLERKGIRRIRGRLMDKELLESELYPDSLKTKVIGYW